MTNRGRSAAWPFSSAGVIALASLGAAAVVAGGVYLVRSAKRGAPRGAEHPAPDLALDRPRPGPQDRAPDAFRPDPTAPVPENERAGLRPATGPAPTLVQGEAAGLERADAVS